MPNLRTSPRARTEARRQALLRQLEMELGYDPTSPDPDVAFAFDINADRLSLDRAYDRFLELRERYPDKIPVLIYEGQGRGKLVIMRLEDATFLHAANG